MTISLNTTRLLTQRKIIYQVHEFPDTIHNAEEVAATLGKPAQMVYKTLVVLKLKPKTKPMLIMLAANQALNLKRVAEAVGEKKVSLAAPKEAEVLTGLKVGGISALALLNKGFDIYIDQPAQTLETILVSAGQRGVNLELPVNDLVKLTKARWIEATG